MEKSKLQLSETALKFMRKINNSKISSYQIKDSWWVISGSICRECEKTRMVKLLKSKKGTEEVPETEVAERLWSIFDELYKKSFYPNGIETAELKELYNKIYEMDREYTDSSNIEAMEKLKEVLNDLPDSEIQRLYEQREKLDMLINYANGLSYRRLSNQ